MLVASKSLYLVRQHNSKNSKLGKVSHYYIPFDVTNLTLLYTVLKATTFARANSFTCPEKWKYPWYSAFQSFWLWGNTVNMN